MKTIKVCYFGVGEKVGKNNMNITRMLENGCQLSYVFVDKKLTNLTSEKDAALLPSILRILQKFRIIPTILKNIDVIKGCDLLYVGFPGHFDMPAAYIVSRIFRKPIVFDPVITLVDTFTDDVGAVRKNSPKALIIKILEKFFYKLADRILVDTNVLKKYFVKEFGVPEERLKVIPLGADEKIYKYKKHTPAKEKDIKVVYYGLYNPLHGVEYIIKAARLLKNNSHIEFLLIGKGKTYPQMLELSKKYKLSNIKFYPEMTEKDALQTLQNGDIFIGFLQSLPSVERFIANKIFQGLALGKAVITADSEAVRDAFVDQKNIFLCRPKSERSVADAILKLQANPRLLVSISANGYTTFTNEYSMSIIGKRLANVFRELVRNNEAI